MPEKKINDTFIHYAAMYNNSNKLGHVERIDYDAYGGGFSVTAELNKEGYDRLFGSKSGFPEITKVIFNGPATIVFFSDGDKVVVKCSDTDDFNPYIGICVAIVKKAYKGRSFNYMIKHLVEKYYDEPRSHLTDSFVKAIVDGVRASLGLGND